MGKSGEGGASNGPGPTRVFFRALQRLRGNDLGAVAAETAYYAILAIAPFLIFLIAGVAIISQYFPIGIVDDLENTVERMAPGETADLLLPLFEEAIERADSGTTSFGMVSAMVLALWSGTRAINALLKGFSRVSQNEPGNSSASGWITALFLSIVMGTVVILSTTVFLFGGALGRSVSSWAGLGGTFSFVWGIISWPLMAAIILLVLGVLYWFGGSGGAKRGQIISPGAVVATVLWLLIMVGIRIFVLIVDPGSIYGALGTFVVLVVFFYVMTIALLGGAAVNAAVRGEETEG